MNDVLDREPIEPATKGPACSVCAPKRIAQILLVLVLVALVGAWLAQSTPSWWRPPADAIRGGAVASASVGSEDGTIDAATSALEGETGLPPGPVSDAEERARALEQGLAAEFTRVRPAGERWAVRVRETDANAWLALRLPKWLAHDRGLPWPEEIDLVQISFDAPDRVIVGAEREGWIWSATLRPRLEQGMLTLEPAGGALGRLWIPWFTPAADRGSSASTLIASFVPELARPVEAILDLPDGRRVKLLDFECDRGEVRFLCETLPR